MVLTDTAIKNAKPKATRWRLFDEGGLDLEISPAGGRRRRLKYRFGGREKRLFVRMAVAGRAARRTVAGGVVQGVKQLLHRDPGVLHQRLHGVDRLQRGVQVHGVVDVEHGLAHVVAAARGAADSLHACLHHVQREHMPNPSPRQRFGIDPKNSAMASHLLKEAPAAALVHREDEQAPPKLRRYVPHWA